MNVKQKPFDDPKVRLAFAYATNKKALTSGEFHGTRSIANGIIPPGMAGYDSSFGGIQFDPQKAKATLAESSYGGPAALPKMTLSVSPGLATLASGMATMYHDTLGVDISIVVLQDAFFQDVSQGKTQMYILGWVADYPDPQDFLEILFGGSSDGNHTGYDNPAVNQLLTEAQNESDVSRRTQLYANAERLIVADAPAIPLYFDSSSNLIQPRVKGLTITPIGIVSFAGVTVGA